MTLFISNDDVQSLLTMEAAMAALESSYARIATEQAVCRPRVDIQIPTSNPNKTFQWGTMEGGAIGDYFAIRMKSDIITQVVRDGNATEEKYCVKPGLYCGLILLVDTRTAEPVAFLNDGILQHMRVGGDGGIGVKYMAREDAEVVGMLGSGGMSRSHMAAFTCVRNIKKLQVFSPTKANREAFATEMAAKYDIETVVCDAPEQVYRGAGILAALTDSTVPVTDGDFVEPGTHVVVIGGSGAPDAKTLDKIGRSLRFGNAPQPWGLPEFGFKRSRITYAAMDEETAKKRMSPDGQRGGRPAVAADRVVNLGDVISGAERGRTGDDQITYSERGNMQGAQFYAVAGEVYERAIETGHKTNEIPTEWLLQDIRD